MKKALFCLLLLVTPFRLSAQEMVAGVFFGESYEYAKKTLDKRFNGGEESYQEKDNLLYSEVFFANEYFDFANFEFQNDGGYTYLYFISFTKHFELSELKEAKELRDNLAQTYYSKYGPLNENIDDKGFKFYFIPKEDGRDYNISISLSKAKNGKGEMKYWVLVSYGPVYTVNPIDEI